MQRRCRRHRQSVIDDLEQTRSWFCACVDEASLAAGPVALLGGEDALDEPRSGRRCVAKGFVRTLEKHAIAGATHNQKAIPGPVHGEESVLRRSRDDGEGTPPFAMQDRSARADHPNFVAKPIDLEKSWKLSPRDPRQIGREDLLLEGASVVVPDEPIAPARAAHCVEVLGVGPPAAIDRLPPQPGRWHALEALAVEAEHRRAGPRHQDRTRTEGLDPPEIARCTRAELSPSLAIEMQDERASALVGTYRVDIGG